MLIKNKYIITVIFLYISLSSLFATVISTNSVVPLGLAFDGNFLWTTDTKTRILTGFDFTKRRWCKKKKLQLPGLRGIAFWRETLVSVYKKYIWIIDPLNGNIVKKIQTPWLQDPISIAIHENIAYIYNRKEHLFYRYSLITHQQLGSFQVKIKSARGATFHQGKLWVISKDNRINHIDIKTGNVLSYIKLPQGAYGASFVKGKLYISFPNEIKILDWNHTDL